MKQGGYYGRRKLGRQILGNKCVRCKSTKNLEFDHINRETKSFGVSKMWSLPWREFLKELKKCQLLCSDCHKKKSAKEARDNIKHGAYFAYYVVGCRCEDCETWHVWYNEQRRLKRRGIVA